MNGDDGSTGLQAAPRVGPVIAILAFALELAVLAAPIVWAVASPGPIWMRIVMALLAEIVLITAWAVFGSPRAPRSLTGRARAGFELAWYAVGAILFVLAGWWPAAVLVMVLETVSLNVRQRASTRIGRDQSG